MNEDISHDATTTIGSKLFDPTAARRCYEAQALARAAVGASGPERLGVNIGKAGAHVLGVLSKLGDVQAELAAHTSFGAEAIAELEATALAAMYAQHVCVGEVRGNAAPGAGEDELRRLVAEGTALRTDFGRQAKELERFGVLPPKSFTTLALGRSKASLPDDLSALAGLFERSWPAIDGNSPLKEAQLARLRVVSGQLNIALSPGGVGEASAAEVLREDLRRAGVLLFTRFERLRAAVKYTRFVEGDADAIAPTFYRVRAPRKRKAATDVAPTRAPSAEAPRSTTNANPGEVHRSVAAPQRPGAPLGRATRDHDPAGAAGPCPTPARADGEPRAPRDDAGGVRELLGGG